MKKILPVITGILFCGVILNTIEQIAPSKVLSINEAALVAAEVESIKYLDSSQMEERILETALSTEAEDPVLLAKISNVKQYLAKRNSPLAQYAEYIVLNADKYGIDYRLVPAISIIESSGGIHTFKRYNAWGWGKRHFSSWEEAIDVVSEGLSKYYAKGMNTPQKIAKYYCPPSAQAWAKKVSFVMGQIGESI
ncbi:MAG: hypothetical protein ACOX0X_00315 [Candidatus Dojkabacteria bacterium]|jgi:hypothetical protein